MLRVFVAHLTKDLNPRSLVYCILQVCKKKVDKADNIVCLLYHILLTGQPFHIERKKNVLYIILFCLS
jgi:hypothetical protein